MAKLYFRYGAMNCGKTTALIQVAHNYHERGLNVVIIKPTLDTKGTTEIVSRIGAKRTVDYLVESDQDITQLISKHQTQGSIDCISADEAQFLTSQQIDQLFLVAVEYNIPVICYGLRADFQTKAFSGSHRLLEIAHKLEEIKTICRCGQKAIFNGRMINGTFTSQGQQVAIDEQDNVSYESLCGHCYLNKVGPVSGSISKAKN